MIKGLYQYLLVETFIPDQHEPTDAKIRVRPLPGQGVPTSLRVECNRKMRELYPVGTIFKIKAKLIDKEGSDFIYSHYNSSYEVLSKK